MATLLFSVTSVPYLQTSEFSNIHQVRELSFPENHTSQTTNKLAKRQNSQGSFSYTPLIFGFLAVTLAYILIRLYVAYRNNKRAARNAANNINLTMRGLDNNLQPIAEDGVVYFSVFRPNMVGGSYFYLQGTGLNGGQIQTPPSAITSKRKVFLTDIELDNNYPAVKFDTYKTFSLNSPTLQVTEDQSAQDKGILESPRPQTELQNIVVLPQPETELIKKSDISGNEGECLICFDPILQTELVRSIPCHHVFHKDCLDIWLKTRSTMCPICRYDLKVRK
ncbi:E3 ubiquitin-protein ligase [Smittium mucronatum]|uniref:E3 ubiquitin-protein ligase n=1 Tax=Smittium mucronatum TaxID=133383 RepID=A0A1R0GLG5_9FUNG|nr:E3 ubiquitin-protein ligase [Smittium mucronatum]